VNPSDAGTRIVWNSFHGRFSDNPRALWERLSDRPGLDHVWLADVAHRHAFPSGVTTVDVDGPEAVAALEAADLLVANTHTELEWEKRPSTTYLQTWHGTPLKRIHRDVLWAPEGRLDRLDRDVAKWDLLLSPNPVSTPRLRGAFRFDGEVLESGYPRNDLLCSPEVDTLGARVRAELGVEVDATVVLYTPTWRDDEVFDEAEPHVPLRDLAAVVDKLGPGTELLVRAHNLVGTRAMVAAAPGVHDVSSYPDVRDLYAAADVLVTDYSSTMFDFAITGRPIVLFTYDLDRFGSQIRGFYFDLEEVAPGPLVREAGDLVELLADPAAWREEYAGRYQAFRDTFASLEDGRATDRVLARLGL
jgi:CDP-glycerol glycerophosphotransferase